MKKQMIWAAYAACFFGCSSEEKPPSKTDRLDSKINQYEKKAMEEEIKSMGDFRVNYSKFVKEMEFSEENEEKARELEREKDKLNEK